MSGPRRTNAQLMSVNRAAALCGPRKPFKGKVGENRCNGRYLLFALFCLGAFVVANLHTVMFDVPLNKYDNE